jgi:thymidylate kinase
MHSYPGKYSVIDGIDRVGKGTLINTIIDYETSKGKTIFDVDDYQIKHQKLPSVDDFKEYDLLILSEPTFSGIGKHIRENLIVKGSLASVEEIARAYAMDRLILFNNVIKPALELNKNVLSSRSVCSSIAYQPLDALEKGVNYSVKDVLSLDGNINAIANAPNLLIIPVIDSVIVALERSKDRGKDDDCKFEEESFLEKNLKIYKSDWLREIFEKEGTIVQYVDTSGTLDDSKRNILEVWFDY